MPEIDVAAYKEAVFGNGQSRTQSQSPKEETASAEKKETVETKPTETPIEEKKVETPPELQEEIVDADEYLKNTLGYDNWETAKTEIEALKQKAQTPAEIKYANEQSKLLHEALLAGKDDEVFDILETKRQISKLDKMSADDVLKLHIQKANRHYTDDDIQDVFDEKYAYPEKPVQSDIEEEDAYKARVEKWKQEKEKIDRRKQRDSISAKMELQKLTAELKLPEIPKPQEVKTNEEDEKRLQKLQAETKEAYSKLSPKDIAMIFKFNDEASKLAFDIAYEPEKESFEKAVFLASDLTEFFKSYYDKDGSPKRVEFLRDLYAGRNINQIVSEAIVQATNQTKKWFLANQKNINGTQRNFVNPPVSDIDKLKQQVFSK